MNSISFEQLAIKHWPSIVSEQYDGWLLRFADGYTKRANSISIFDTSTLHLDEKIPYVEQYYKSKNIPTIFNISPARENQQLDYYLGNIGYDKQAPTLVKSRALDNLHIPKPADVDIIEHISIKWIEQYCQLSGTSEATMGTMIDLLSRITATTLFITLKDNNKVVACGLGVVEKGFIGLYCIVTHPQQRNKGYGEQLILHLLHYAKHNGVHTSYLAVEEGNAIARGLYAKLQFQTEYRYWYRSKSVR